MIEIAVRVGQLVSSNVNSLVDQASNPVKLLGLLVTEIEEAIIALTGDAARRDRAATDLAQLAQRHEQSSAEWQDKAKLAMIKDREDLARGALAERENARAAASQAEVRAADAAREAAALRTSIAELEAKRSEVRQRLAELKTAQLGGAAGRDGAAVGSGAGTRVDRVMDRIEALEKRADFAAADAPGSKAASLDLEIAELKREAALDAALDDLRKAAKKARK